MDAAADQPDLFGHILAPWSLDDFVRDIHDRSALRIARNDPAWFAEILTVADVERVVTTLAPPFPRLRLVTQSEALAAERFTFPDGASDPTAVFAAFHQGATVILDQLHRTVPGLARLTRSLETVLHAPIQTNIYYTPPGGQGFRAHYDTHDVFVLQVAGSKAWRLYDSPLERPLPSQPFEDWRPDPGAESDRFRLDPGDTLYLPRGLMHEAEATADTASLHVTVGVLGRAMGDVLVDAVAEWVRGDAAARAALLPGYAAGGPAASMTADAIADLARRAVDGLDVRAALDRRGEAFIAAQRPLRFDPSARETEAADVGLATPLMRRRDLTVRLSATPDEEVMLLAEGRQVLLPASTRPALERLMDGAAHRPEDLPGPLDGEERLVLCRRLVREGILQSR